MDTTIAAPRLITVELTQQQALNLAASIASDFNNAIDLMPKEFQQRHRELFDLLVAELPDADKSHVIACMTGQGVTK